jgi:hypothetical protein
MASAQKRKQPGRWKPRMNRAPKNRRRPNPLQVVLRTGLVVAGMQGLWFLFHTPRLAVRRVEVIGADRLGAERVKQLAAIPVGRNIFSINLFRARVRVEGDPLVASAEVSRALPNAVRVLVHERRPVFVVADRGRLFEADAEGVLFRATGKPVLGLPILSLQNQGPISVGDKLPDGTMKSATACCRLMAADHMTPWKICVDGAHELCLNMKVSSHAHPKGVILSIRLGRPEDLPLKLSDARRIVAGRPQILEEAQYLDVSCAGRPVYLARSTPGSSLLSARGITPGTARPMAAPLHP